MTNEELIMEIQAGAVERMGELWEQVEKLVKWKANHVMTALDLRGNPCGVEFDDLYQSGYIAMVKAVHTYDPAAGTAFSTWLIPYLKTAFAEATGRRTRRGQNEPLNNSISLETPLSDDADSDDLMDVIADPAGLQWRESLEESMWRKELQEAVESALSTVPEQYREILRLRYWEDMTLRDIADLRGISWERVRQMENKGIRLLRQPRNACHLRPFYNFDFYCHTSLSAFNQTGMSVQERYLMIEEERKEREAKERKRRDDEWQRRVEESQRWFAEYQTRRAQETKDVISRMTPEEKARLLAEYGYA